MESPKSTNGTHANSYYKDSSNEIPGIQQENYLETKKASNLKISQLFPENLEKFQETTPSLNNLQKEITDQESQEHSTGMLTIPSMESKKETSASEKQSYIPETGNIEGGKTPSTTQEEIKSNPNNLDIDSGEEMEQEQNQQHHGEEFKQEIDTIQAENMEKQKSTGNYEEKPNWKCKSDYLPNKNIFQQRKSITLAQVIKVIKILKKI